MREKLVNALCWLVIFLAGSGMVCIIVATRVHAHDPHTHQANALADAKSPLHGLCCSGDDYIIPGDWSQNEDGSYHVLIGKDWIDVPKEAEVTNMKNPDMEAKAWVYYLNGKPVARCFMPGGQT